MVSTADRVQIALKREKKAGHWIIYRGTKRIAAVRVKGKVALVRLPVVAIRVRHRKRTGKQERTGHAGGTGCEAKDSWDVVPGFGQQVGQAGLTRRDRSARLFGARHVVQLARLGSWAFDPATRIAALAPRAALVVQFEFVGTQHSAQQSSAWFWI